MRDSKEYYGIFEKGLWQLNTKPTQRYVQPRLRQQIESSTDATLLDWLLEDAMVAFCYCCSHNIDVQMFQVVKKDNITIIVIIMNHSNK